MTRLQKITLAIAGTAAYFAAAVYLQRSYIDPRPKGRVVIQLFRPFDRESGMAFSATNILPGDQATIAELGDDPNVDGDQRSLVVLYEDNKMIGHAHSYFKDIAKSGEGRFGLWNGQPLVFSSSDNSNPNTNGHRYWAVIPYP